MKHFLSVKEAGDIMSLVGLAKACKAKPYENKKLGENKTMGLIFMNPSLRTRLSTQKAALNLGMNVMIMSFTGEGWALETEEGVIMNGDKAEHIIEAAAVVGEYCDIIGLRSFPSLKDQKADYAEPVLNAFVKYSGKPLVNMESATRHPLQSLADVLTIEEFKTTEKPKVVLTWANHPRALPQSVPNSFAEWINQTDYEFVIAQPEGFELSKEFSGKAKILYNQDEAFEGADFIYAKNWSSYKHYGERYFGKESWMVSAEKMKLTNNAKFMHCLPVRRNVIVEDAVIDSTNSIVIQEAGNRVWAAQAVIQSILQTN